MSPRRPDEDPSPVSADPGAIERLRRGEHSDPHAILGAHPVAKGVVVRAFHPEAEGAELVAGSESRPMESIGEGVFAVLLRDRSLPVDYQLRFRFAGGATWECGDPYRFLPTLGDLDLHLLGEGQHRRLWSALGARPCEMDGVSGTAFSVWAPSARRVSVVGDFCAWDGRLRPMRALGSTGVWELFVPDAGPGALYKFEIKTREGAIRLKSDPLAGSAETPPGTASRVVRSDYAWTDQDWMRERARRDVRREPVSVYEVHLGSWMRVPEESHRWLRYREIAPRLAEHVRDLGFTHVELLPVAEHPFYGSWGYQVTGYYAPSARYGTPDDFRYLVDTLHRHGIGVILDWVPAHFPRDDHALRRFDGTALYEHEDPRRGEHPDWGTLIFNYGRTEVRNFLLANALYWLLEFHVDGLRVDAVASMLYHDYSRETGQWIPNVHGGRENLEAVAFFGELSRWIREEAPGTFTVAEESTAWPGVTAAPADGGLGFGFKWNMGWMHDTLAYFQRDPIYRSFHQDELSFAMIYEQHERFVNPLSHDEVVHGKGSLLSKMPGDRWQKFANLRALYGYQFTRPGKKLLFMGSELAPDREWSHDDSLDWHLLDEPMHAGVRDWLRDLAVCYRETPCLWRRDPDPESFEWIDCSDAASSVYAYLRRDGDHYALVVLNLSPVPREGYRVGAPGPGRHRVLLSSDERRYGGSEVELPQVFEAQPVPWHGREWSLVLTLPPLGALVLAPSD